MITVIEKMTTIIKNRKKEVIAFCFLVAVISIFLISNAFAALVPTKSVIITSQKTSYEEKEPGSWQVEKSGKWISKGKARVTFDVDTTLMTEDKDTDVILVLDISGSMSGDKLDRVKTDSTELIDSLLSNKNNNAALITFDTESTIVSDFTNDKDYLINEINNLGDTGSTNYYQPLVNVDTLLKDYVKTDDKEVIVLFLTDGYPNEDTPNQIAQYQTLKKNYPYITINGIQYEMGETILDPIKEISDNQFFADMETLNNVLFDASVSPISYDEFQIVDYIDNDYFILKSEDDITVSQGNVKLEEENGKQKITWTIPSFKSGRDAKLMMDVNLKDEYIGQGGIYPTNEREEIISKIVNIPDEDVVSTKTPVLADNYKVTYDGNSPDGSTVSNVPEEANYSVFDTISLTTEEPSCVGYEFKGWEIVNKDVTRVGEDHFIMPEEDVVVRAKWSKVEVSKSMNGTVNNMGDSIMKKYYSFSSADYHNDEYRNKVTSIVTKDNLKIPTTAIEYWDVSEAGDGSVVAYIEDDGSGNGTYKVTIGGQGGIIANSDSSSLFYNFENVNSIDLTYLDTGRVIDLSRFFYNCNHLVNIVFGDNFDTSNVTDMMCMFYNCLDLIDLDLSNFDTSKVTDMSYMFYLCRGLTNIIFGDNFDTSSVVNMGDMFSSCEKLLEIDLKDFNTSNVIDMSGMFANCRSLSTIDVSGFDTSKVTDMSYMFYGCAGLSNLVLSNFVTSKVTDMSYMFQACTLLTSLDLSNFDTSKVENMEWMFYICNEIMSLDLSNFDTSNVTSMSYMFSECWSLTDLNISSFNTEKVRDMSSMFNGSYNLTNLDLSNFNTSNVTDMSHMFYDCYGLTELNVSSFDTSNTVDMSYMFALSSSITIGRVDTKLEILDFSDFDTKNVTNMAGMFMGCDNLIDLDVSNFNTSKVTDMSEMFMGCQRLTDLDLSNFDTSQVTDMSEMFAYCDGFARLKLSNFVTRNVTNMTKMFYECSGLISLKLDSFDTSSVTDMSEMFAYCTVLTDLDLSTFDTTKLGNMRRMFYACQNLLTLDMRKADFSSVISYDYMFSPYSININVNVIVKDSDAASFIRARLDESSLTDATVTIANPATQTSLFELGPRKFGPLFVV